MPSCAYCLEDIKVGARKCPHCQTLFEIDTKETDTTVYILDKGLIRFAKFAGTILAMFILVGIYLFGIDIKEASESTSQAKIEVQKALLEIEKQKILLNSQIDEIETRVDRIEQLERDIAIHREETQTSAALVKQLVIGLRRDREEAGEIISELRKLGASETTVAVTKRAERGIEADRGKLWAVGSSLMFHFIDGEEREKTIVRAAIERWSEYVNLAFSETASPEAEIRISFKQPGSWSYVGTDALGISLDMPTLNFGFLAQLTNREMAMQTALHEFGHALGLVHEFQNPSGNDIFNRETTLTYFKGAPSFWSEEQIMLSVLRRYDSKQYPGTRAYDPASIMNYSFPQKVFLPGKETRPGFDLSESDKQYVAALYPYE